MTKKTSKEWAPVTTDAPAYISLPWSAFFDQDLGDIIYNKLMKAPVKDYQILLRLSKLGQTINKISQDLAKKRDEIAKECGLEEFLNPNASLTPETLNSPEYQEKSKHFGEMLQQSIFNNQYSLEPLGTLILDLNSPDGHAKAFLEGSTLSADDIMKLSEMKILTLKDWDWQEEDSSSEESTLPAEEESATADSDVLVPNHTDSDDK